MPRPLLANTLSERDRKDTEVHNQFNITIFYVRTIFQIQLPLCLLSYSFFLCSFVAYPVHTQAYTKHTHCFDHIEKAEGSHSRNKGGGLTGNFPREQTR